MSEQMEVRSALVRLSRVLGVDVEDLRYLERVGSAALVEIRKLVLDRLYAGEDDLLGRVAASSKLLPVGLIAKIAPKSVPPMLAAALVGQIEAERGVRVAAKLPPEYLAEAATLMDPRKAAGVIPHAEVDVMLPVGEVLVARKEFVAMGALVPLFSDEVLRAALPIIDDAGLLQLAFAVEDKEKLDHLVSLVHARLAGIIQAADRDGLWVEALEVTSYLGDENRGVLADIASRQSDEVLDNMLRIVADRGLGEQLLRLAGAASPPARRRLVGMPGAQNRELIASLVRRAAELGLWPDLLKIAAVAPSTTLNRAGSLLGELDDAQLDAAVTAAKSSGQFATLVALTNEIPGRARARLTSRPGFADEAAAGQLVAGAVREDSWNSVLPLVSELPEDGQQRVADQLGRLSDGALADAVVAADGANRLPELLTLAATMPQRAREAVLQVVTDPAGAFGQLAPMLSAATQPDTWRKVLAATGGAPQLIAGVLARADALGVGDRLAALTDPQRVAADTEAAVGRAQTAVSDALGRLPGGRRVADAAEEAQGRVNYAAVRATERVTGKDLSGLYAEPSSEPATEPPQRPRPKPYPRP